MADRKFLEELDQKENPLNENDLFLVHDSNDDEDKKMKTGTFASTTDAPHTVVMRDQNGTAEFGPPTEDEHPVRKIELDNFSVLDAVVEETPADPSNVLPENTFWFHKENGKIKDFWVSDGSEWLKLFQKAENIFFDGSKNPFLTETDALQAIIKIESRLRKGFRTYVGGRDEVVRCYEPYDIFQKWAFTSHNGQIVALTTDFNGFVYSGSGDNTIRKLSPTGQQIWSYSAHNNNVYAVAVDQDGFVYFGSDDNTARKLDPDGNLVWTFSGHSSNVRGIAVDVNGFVFTGSADTTVRKLNPDGTQIWSYNGPNIVRQLKTDLEGNVVVAYSSSFRKIDSDGNLVWTFSGHSGTAYGVAIDDENSVYISATDGVARKLNPNGSQIWSNSLGGSSWYADVDVERCMYVGLSSPNRLVKLSPSGSFLWEVSFSNWVRGIANWPGDVGAGFWGRA